MPPKPSKATSNAASSAGKRIVGFTPLQKYELCKLREKHPTMKLAEFAQLNNCPKRPDGRPLAISSLSDHLKGWKERIKEGPPAGTKFNKN